jgi:hypothetical protein
MDNGKDIFPRQPWTQEQLQELLPKLKAEIAREEAQDPNIRPLPPMTVDECKDFFYRLNDIASTRPLTGDECCIMGQLLAVFQYAVRAETLGRKGRYFVLSEEDINRMMQEQGVQ